MKCKILLVILSFLFSFHSQAQVVERYMRSKANKVTNRIFNKLDEKVDSILYDAVDKTMEKEINKIPEENKEEESDSESSSKSTQGKSGNMPRSYNALMKKTGSSDASVNISEAYSYKGYLLMEMESWDENGTKGDPVLYSTFYSEDNKNFALEYSESGEKSIIIFDNNAPAMIFLTDNGKEKSGLIIPVSRSDSENLSEPSLETDSKENITNEAYESDFLYTNYKKTGNRKKICGYNCEEYIWEDEDDIINFWVSKELPAELYTRIFSLNILSGTAFTGINYGFTMEWDMRGKNGAERSKMQIKEIDKNKSTTIKTSGYELINAGNFY